MKRKQKVLVVTVFAIILALAGIAAAVWNVKQTQEGTKQFQIEIISDRDGYEQAMECESTEEFLGQYLRTMEGCEWQESDYGIYITGFYDMMENTNEQYWWCVSVNHEDSMTGADSIPLADGDVYTFTLKQGW